MVRFGLPVLVAGAIFLFDMSVPLGFAGGLPYVALVLVGLRSPNKNDIFVLAAVGTVLVVFGCYVSAESGFCWIALTNRGLALFAIWATAILCYRQRIADESLEYAHARLEGTVVNLDNNLAELASYKNALDRHALASETDFVGQNHICQ